jgi:hypothetical protein
MVNKYIRCGAIVALAAVCSAASAAPNSEWRDLGEFQGKLAANGLSGMAFGNASGLATQFDAGNGFGDSSGRARVASAALTLDGQTAQAVAATSQSADDSRRAHALAITSDTTTLGSAAAVQLTLWNFVANVRAQQTGNQFQSLVATSSNIDITLNGVPAPVPLPPAGWLFLGGLGLLAAMQWRVRRAPRGPAAA